MMNTVEAPLSTPETDQFLEDMWSTAKREIDEIDIGE
jgi:hypothetical protein